VTWSGGQPEGAAVLTWVLEREGALASCRAAATGYLLAGRYRWIAAAPVNSQMAPAS